jgi:hypothetical protein
MDDFDFAMKLATSRPAFDVCGGKSSEACRSMSARSEWLKRAPEGSQQQKYPEQREQHCTVAHGQSQVGIDERNTVELAETLGPQT